MNKNIDHNSFLNESPKLVEILQVGFIDLENNDLISLDIIANYLLENYPKCFWGYCFKSISETGINITKPINNISYQIKDDDIQEDIKSRLYFLARNKYKKSSRDKYEMICDFYKDIPLENKDDKRRANTIYDEKISYLKSLKHKYNLIETKYLHEMRIYSISEQEVAIVHNIELWGRYIDHALKDLEKYNDKVESLVKADYKKTPNPGNKKIFIFYSIFMVLSLLLISLGVTRSLFSVLVNYDTYFFFHLINSTISSILLLVISGMFIAHNKIFNKYNPILVGFLILLELIIISLNVVSAFTSNNLALIISIIMALFGLVALPFTFFKLNYYLPRNTYKCGSYIGNFKALCSNNFKINFTYNWEVYLEGSELDVGDISDYLSPYMEVI